MNRTDNIRNREVPSHSRAKRIRDCIVNWPGYRPMLSDHEQLELFTACMKDWPGFRPLFLRKEVEYFFIGFREAQRQCLEHRREHAPSANIIKVLNLGHDELIFLITL